MSGPARGDKKRGMLSEITIFSSCTSMRPSEVLMPGSNVMTIPGTNAVVSCGMSDNPSVNCIPNPCPNRPASDPPAPPVIALSIA